MCFPTFFFEFELSSEKQNVCTNNDKNFSTNDTTFWMEGQSSMIFIVICASKEKALVEKFTCNRPSSVLWIVTHLLGCAPFVVMAVIRESNSSRFSFNFLTNDSMALLANPSLSPPWRWHMSEWTIDRHASALVGADVFISRTTMRRSNIRI